MLCSGPGERPDVLLVDLRNNGGGLLQGAVETSNLFLNPGEVETAEHFLHLAN